MKQCTRCGEDVLSYYYENGEAFCEDCYSTPTSALLPASSDEWVNGTWDHITSEPVRITGGKKELKEICNKHGVIPKAFAKPCSQGKGWTWNY